VTAQTGMKLPEAQTKGKIMTQETESQTPFITGNRRIWEETQKAMFFDETVNTASQLQLLVTENKRLMEKIKK